MIKLICDWCSNEVQLSLEITNRTGYLIVTGSSGTTIEGIGWHIDSLVRYSDRIQVDLCPDCKTIAEAEKAVATVKAQEIMNDAIKKATETKEKLIADAQDSAKQQRTIRIERDTEMRKKERQRIADGG